MSEDAIIAVNKIEQQVVEAIESQSLVKLNNVRLQLQELVRDPKKSRSPVEYGTLLGFYRVVCALCEDNPFPESLDLTALEKRFLSVLRYASPLTDREIHDIGSMDYETVHEVAGSLIKRGLVFARRSGVYWYYSLTLQGNLVAKWLEDAEARRLQDVECEHLSNLELPLT